MDGNITGENDERVGLYVDDNNGVEHWIEMEFDGEIKYHEQDGYPDKPANRTEEGNEHVKQARRYARYYVYHEQGYLTIEPQYIPEWQAVVTAVVTQQSTDEFAEWFSQYHQQYRSAVEDDIQPVIEIPESDVAGLLAYLQQISLDFDLDSVINEETRRSIRTAVEADPDPDAIATAVLRALSDKVLTQDAFSVGQVSNLGALYQTSEKTVTTEPTDLYTDSPDARLELIRVNSPLEEYLSPAAFHLLIAHHLLCQCRDCYLRMGLEPPTGLRILGLGKFQQVVRNTHLDMYQMVHQTDADIDGYQLPDVGYDIEL